MLVAVAGVGLGRFSFLVDHYVLVLEVGDKEVVLGHPFKDKDVLTRAEFEKKWKRIGIVLAKSSAPHP